MSESDEMMSVGGVLVAVRGDGSGGGGRDGGVSMGFGVGRPGMSGVFEAPVVVGVVEIPLFVVDALHDDGVAWDRVDATGGGGGGGSNGSRCWTALLLRFEPLSQLNIILYDNIIGWKPE